MATFYAAPSVKTSFAGGANELVCDTARDGEYVISAPSMIQVTSEGILLNAVTISCRGYNTSTYDTVTFSDAKATALIGAPGHKISSIKISGAAAGAYSFTFIPVMDK